MTRPISVIEAPSILGLSPSGVETLPEALLRAGLAARLQAQRVTRVPAPPFDPRIDPKIHLLNPEGIAAYTPHLADAVERVLDGGEFPLVLGGDCSIVLGGLLALRRKGRYGLLFLDGHADFYQPEAEPKGEAASMDLALATGRGPSIVTTFEGFHPLVRDDDVVLLGRRDAEDAEKYGSQRVEDTAIEVMDLQEVRRRGAVASASRGLERLGRSELQGFWIHVDADVLDDTVMPAVDYRMPGGLSFEELSAVLRTALASGKAVGLEVTIFNPKLDRDGSIARSLSEALVRGLS